MLTEGGLETLADRNFAEILSRDARLDISWNPLDWGLEWNDLERLIEAIPPTAIKHPKSFSALTMGSAFAEEILDSVTKHGLKGILVAPWYAAYGPPAVINDYKYSGYEDKKIIDIPEGLIEKGYVGLLNNRRLATLVGATAFGLIVSSHYDDSYNFERFIAASNLAGLIGTAGLGLLRNSYVMKESQVDSSLEQGWNKIWEHPFYFFSIIGLLSAVKFHMDVDISIEQEIGASILHSITWASAFTGLYLGAGGLVHSNSVKKIKSSGLSRLYALAGGLAQEFPHLQAYVDSSYQKAEEHQRRLLDISMNKTPSYLALYNLQVKQGEYDAAIDSLDQAILQSRKSDRFLSLNDILKKATYMDKLSAYTDIFLNLFEPTVHSKINLAMRLLSLGHVRSAILCWDAAVEAGGTDAPELNILYAKSMELVGDNKKCAEQWMMAITNIADSDRFIAETIGESANSVYQIGPGDFLKNTFVFKEGKLKELDQEVDITLNLDYLVREEKKFLAPNPLALVNKKKDYYVMERDSGDSLLARIDEKHPEFESNLEDAVDYLAFIHARLPSSLEDTQLSPVDYTGSTFARLSQSNAAPYLADIVQSYTPITQSLETSIWSFNKDAHPENWIVNEEGQIIAIDCENKGLTPITLDIANLLNYGNYWNGGEEQEKTRLLGKYAASFNKFSEDKLIDDFEDFSLQFWNATIHRAFAYYGFFHSKPDKRKKYCAAWLGNGIKAITAIMRNHNEFFQEYRSNYYTLLYTLTDLFNSEFHSQVGT